MVATARIAVEHGSFNRNRQLAPICTPNIRVIQGSLGLRESVRPQNGILITVEPFLHNSPV